MGFVRSPPTPCLPLRALSQLDTTRARRGLPVNARITPFPTQTQNANRLPSQLSGLALTTTTCYLTLTAHRLHRTTQSTSLRQQSRVLNDIVDPPSPYKPRRSRRDLYDYEAGGATPEERALLAEHERGVLGLARDGWNRQVEGLVRTVAEADYRALREGLEARGLLLWRRLTDGLGEKGA